MAPTLIDELVPTVDEIRAIHTDLGTRPYRVWLVWTRWSGGRRGDGVETVTSETEILPTPRIGELSGLAQLVKAIGRDEDGSVTLSEITLTLSEEDLLPREIGDAQSFYYEIREGEGRRRRYFPSSVPEKQASRVGWMVRLALQEGARTDDGRTAGRPW